MHRVIMASARAMAALGGAVLVALVVMTCLSVLGRELGALLQSDALQGYALAGWVRGLGIGAVYGDFELVEAGVAFCIFAFLPLCHLTGGHATVDILAERFPRGAQRVLAALIAVVFAAVMVVIAVQLFAGMLSMRGSGRTSALIEFPIWWAYAGCMAGAALAAVVAVYLAAVRCAEAWLGVALIADSESGAT
ncbi:MAG: TRAP transporter small permease [Octadecabacter sp.]|nr:TRAP transporter small permease [Octadecabacter sp.]